MSMRERLNIKLARCPDPGCECLLWDGQLNSDGYGVISVGGVMRRVHSVAWELEHPPVPDGMVLDHVRARGCHHRNCALTAHLEPVTRRENTLRGDTIPAANATKTHCGHGHLFDPANTYRDKRGHRYCRACDRRKKAERAVRRRLAVPAPA